MCGVAWVQSSAEAATVKRALRALSRCLVREIVKFDDKVSPESEIAKTVVVSKKCNRAFDRVLSAYPGGEKETREVKAERDALLEEHALRLVRNVRDTRQRLLEGWE